MSDIVEKLRDAFNRSRYFGDEAYYPDGDLFDVAADHIAALEARKSRLEEQVREAYERAAEAAEGERYAQHYVDASASAGDMRPDIYNEACNDVAEAIRTLTTEQTNG